jgi:hypothetical protein
MVIGIRRKRYWIRAMIGYDCVEALRGMGADILHRLFLRLRLQASEVVVVLDFPLA